MSTKAFELVPALERSKLLSDLKVKDVILHEENPLQITAINCSIRHLFIGTSSGQLIHYVLDEKPRPEGRVSYQTHLQSRRSLLRRGTAAISLLHHIASLDKLLVLSDGILYIADVTTLEITSHEKLKNAQTFAVDSSDDTSNPFAKQVCVGSRKRHVQLYNLTGDKWIHIRDIGLPEPPSRLCLDGKMLCAALQTRYMMVRTDTSNLLDLFPFDFSETNPLVERVSPGEFVLAAPGELGMFVVADGSSRRPPVQLQPLIHSMVLVTPYLISLSEDSISIHNVLDQQRKQVIRFSRGLSLCVFGDRVLVSAQLEVFSLVPVPWQKQVDNLLADQRVEEALQLAQASGRSSGLSADQFDKVYKVLLQKSGFIAFSQQEFDKAQAYFSEGQVDTREIISLFPNLLPSNRSYARTRPALHEFADINLITRGNINKMEESKAFLVRYLENTHYPTNQKMDVHTALLRIYCENDVPNLLALLKKGYKGDEASAIDTLQTYGRHDALARLHAGAGHLERALSTWARLLSGELEDSTVSQSSTLSEMAQVLSKCDSQLLFEFSPVVLDRDQDLAAKIFTAERPDTLRPNAVMEFLTPYVKAQLHYLEYTVIQKESQDGESHSSLVMAYLNHITAAKRTNEQSEDIQLTRAKLQSFLESSSRYSINLIIGRLERDSWFLPEMAILYGKSGRDDKALDILVKEKSDVNHRQALDYCIRTSERKETLAERQRLFELLLDLLLVKTQSDERVRVDVIDLLNNPSAYFDAAKVAEKVPPDWSVAVISKFLLNSVRLSLHSSRQMKIMTRLAQADFYQVKREQLNLERKYVSLTDNRRCDLCHQLFKESSFVKLADGKVVHIRCFKPDGLKT